MNKYLRLIQIELISYICKKNNMKKIILFILIFAQVSFVAAQSFIVSGDTIVFGESDVLLEHHLDVKNISNNDLDVICVRTVLVLPLNYPTFTAPYFCFAEFCYSSTTDTSNVSTLNSGQQFAHSNGDVEAHTGYYNAQGLNGIAKVKYCFYDVDNPTDETCVTITYETSTTAINDYQPLTKLGDFYPNPASEMVYFSFNGNVATLKLIDILGNNVKEILLSKEGIQELDLSDINKGIYFGNLIVNSEVVSIKKLIVK